MIRALCEAGRRRFWLSSIPSRPTFFDVRVKARRRVLASFAPLARLVLVSAYGTYQTRSVQEGKGYSFSKIRDGHDRYRSDEDREERR